MDQSPPLPQLSPSALSRRQRQTLDALYRLRSATVSELRREVPGDPSYSAIRAVLRTLDEKGLVKHRQRGPRYVYSPGIPADHARRSALEYLVRTFFDGSPEEAAVALLDMSDGTVADETLERLAKRIDETRREGR